MTASGPAAQREFALAMLAHRAGPASNAEAVAAAADRAYDDLARLLVPIIGDVGVSALTDRAIHLAGRDYPWLVAALTPAAEEASRIGAALKQQDPAEAARAAAAVFAAFLGLLATFIGEPLAARLVRQAWPDVSSSADTEKT